jgi:hypothetical protein
MQPVVLELYQAFLGGRPDEEEWPNSLPGDEVQANLVHANYMSAADLAFCSSFDIQSLRSEPGFEAKQALHQSLVDMCSAEEDGPA